MNDLRPIAPLRTAAPTCHSCSHRHEIPADSGLPLFQSQKKVGKTPVSRPPALEYNYLIRRAFVEVWGMQLDPPASSHTPEIIDALTQQSVWPRRLATGTRGRSGLPSRNCTGETLTTMLKKLLFASLLCLRLVGFGLTIEKQMPATDCPACNPPPDCAPWENCS